jgi:hypothetical protein
MNFSMIDLMRMLHSLSKGIILETVLICFMIFLLFFTPGYFGLLWNTYGQNDLYLNLSSNNGNSSFPQISIIEDKIYVTWTDNTTGNGDVYFKASSDSGFTFSSIKNLSNNTGASLSPHIAASGNNVYVIWTDNTTGNGDVYFKASLENGNKFKGKKLLAKNIGNSLQPQMAVSQDGNLIFGVWKDNTKYDPPENATSPDFDLLFRTSSNQGGNFSDRNIIGKNVGDFADFPQIAIPAKTRDAAVVWSDVYKYRQPATSDIFYQAIIGNGTTLAEPINLSNNEGNSTMPNIAFSDDSMANIVWSDSTTGNGDIYFARIK